MLDSKTSESISPLRLRSLASYLSKHAKHSLCKSSLGFRCHGRSYNTLLAEEELYINVIVTGICDFVLGCEMRDSREWMELTDRGVRVMDVKVCEW